jgi:hypothetical protein
MWFILCFPLVARVTQMHLAVSSLCYALIDVKTEHGVAAAELVVMDSSRLYRHEIARSWSGEDDYWNRNVGQDEDAYRCRSLRWRGAVESPSYANAMARGMEAGIPGDWGLICRR